MTQLVLFSFDNLKATTCFSSFCFCPFPFTEGINKFSTYKTIVENCSCMKVKRNSGKANYTAKNAPPFCEVWFIYKGKHIWTREASETPCYSSSCTQPEIATRESLRCRSFQYGNELFDSEYLQPNSARTTTGSGSRSWVQGEIIETEAIFSSSCSSHCSPQNSSRAYLDTYLEAMEERINKQLIETKREAEAVTDEAFTELLKCEKLEVEAMEAIRKVNKI